MKTGLWLPLLAAALLIGVGCETTPPSGSSFAMQPALEMEYLPQSVIVKGNVRHPVLPWTEDLTVTRAIVKAEYVGLRTPITISIQRQGERLFVDPVRLQFGIIDPWLEAGDILELHMSTQIRRPYDWGQYENISMKAISD
jgi:hypothetical protein